MNRLEVIAPLLFPLALLVIAVFLAATILWQSPLAAHP